MPAVTHEFFYTNKAFTHTHHDFTDRTLFSNEQRMAFLDTYGAYLKQTYSLPDTPEKVLTEEKADDALAALKLEEPLPQVSERLLFSTMQASLVPVPAVSGWHFYTPRAFVKEEAVVFAEGDLPPTPAATLALDPTDPLSELSFSVYIDSRYAVPIPGGVLGTTTGRTVELRRGISDIVKLHFYPDGTCYVRLGNECPYELKNICIGTYSFDCWQTVTLRLLPEGFCVCLNGKESGLFPYSEPLVPDTLFVGSGMFHVGEWRFKPLRMVTATKTVTDFFSGDTEAALPPEPVGEVTLPYRVGGYDNRDKAIVLEREFACPSHRKALLSLDALDPCGAVYINDKPVLETDGFEAQCVDIAPYLQEGINRLKLVVFPRAPETLFNWHRQKDPYNGWFCDKVTLTFVNACTISELSVVTDAVSETACDCTVSASFSKAQSARICLQKIFPETEPEQEIGLFPLENGELRASLHLQATPWTPDAPTLYAVRVFALDESGQALDDEVIETGFRTVRQQNGAILLNGKPLVLTGALLMQFLPPHAETSVTHICPRSEQILQQELLVKALGGNTLRLHILGYGSNDERYARYADRIGLMLIWTTRFIDSVEQMMFSENWPAKAAYVRQVRARRHHPSIVMWEGTNEYHPSLQDINRIYREFVPAVKAVDSTRLLCPISHLYYAGDLYPKEGCGYYNDSGTADHNGDSVTAPVEWNDPLVVRSAHTYKLLLGYGTGWDKLREHSWSIQPDMYHSKEHAYLITEYAVIGRQNPTTPDAQVYFNEYSYEFPDENVLGFRFTREQWRESQAYQALAAKAASQVLRLNGADGMLWCCLMSGANDGGYLKPPIDCYGYPKLAFYTLRESFQPLQVVSADVDVLKPNALTVRPVVIGTGQGKAYTVSAEITDRSGRVLQKQEYRDVTGNEAGVALPEWKPEPLTDGYYAIRYQVTEKSE